MANEQPEYRRELNINITALTLVRKLPYKSYTRKMVGYLYAISRGAEWIYDTDDDNRPAFGGLETFDYSEEISGVRFERDKSDDLRLTFHAHSKNKSLNSQ